MFSCTYFNSLDEIVINFFQLMYFSANVSYASLPVYLPTILKDMGYGSVNAQGLSAPPYFLAFLFALITTFTADRTQQRGLVITTTCLVGGTGYIILATVTHVGVRYFAVFLASAGVFSTIPNILAWTLSMWPEVTHLCWAATPSRLELTCISRQPGQRLAPWCWSCPHQCSRPMRPRTRHPPLPRP